MPGYGNVKDLGAPDEGMQEQSTGAPDAASDGMQDMGYTHPKSTAGEMATSPNPPEKPQYPSFTVNKSTDKKVGEECLMTAKVKVVSTRANENERYGPKETTEYQLLSAKFEPMSAAPREKSAEEMTDKELNGKYDAAMMNAGKPDETEMPA